MHHDTAYGGHDAALPDARLFLPPLSVTATEDSGVRVCGSEMVWIK